MLLGLVLDTKLWEHGTPNVLVGIIGHVGLGILFSLIAQMGFFAYLAIHSFGLGLFRGLWSGVQSILIIFTFFDLVYFRYVNFAEGSSILPFFGFPTGMLVFALIIAYIKVKQTNNKAGVPTVFLIFVVSTIEWMPALHQDQLLPLLNMLIPILLCNAWQVLQLHKLTVKTTQKPPNGRQKA